MMCKRQLGLIAAVTAMQLGVAGAAQAQAWVSAMIANNIIGQNASQQQETACRNGASVPASFTEEAANFAAPRMKDYWDTALAGQAPLGSFILDKHTRWTSGTTALDSKGLAAIKDPFAVAENEMKLEPAGFVRSGDGISALGHWQVRDSAGKPVGTYRAVLRYKSKKWLLSTLDLIAAGSWIDPVVLYCHVPGDVLGYRLAEAKAGLADAEKRLALARQQEAAAQVSSDKAKAQAEAAPGYASKQEAAKEAAEKLRQASDNANGFQSQYDTQRAKLARTEAELQAFEAQREAAKAAQPGTP